MEFEAVAQTGNLEISLETQPAKSLDLKVLDLLFF
jgi:hypothetical protein